MIKTVTDCVCEGALATAAHTEALGGGLQIPCAKKEMYVSPKIKLIKMEPVTLMDYTGKNIVRDKGNITGDTGNENVTDLGGGDNTDWGGWQ